MNSTQTSTEHMEGTDMGKESERKKTDKRSCITKPGFCIPMTNTALEISSPPTENKR